MPASYIVDFVRTPFTAAYRGALTGVRPDDLAAHALKALVSRSGVEAAALEDVILGCAFPEAEQGLNIARCSVLLAGLPQTIGGSTINRWCGSSMQAIQMAAGAISMDAGELMVAGGVESMTRVPMMGLNPMPNPRWSDDQRKAVLNMGYTAENLARAYGISRQEQDQYALESQGKAAAAQQDGQLAEELTPVETANGIIDKDGCVRAGTTLEALGELKTAFEAVGTVTAGNASPLTDGASMTMIASEDAVKTHSLKPMARIASFAISGCAPEVMGIGPVEATRKALARAGIATGDLDVIEMNEAFAVQVLACCQDLDIAPERLNKDGGAIALGHPLGATGARLVGKAASLLRRDGGRYALATQCIGGGQGISMVLERA